MAVTKQKKVEILDTLEKGARSAQSMVFVGFRKLTVKDTEELRRKLRAERVSYYVAKKTLIRKALSQLGLEGTMPEIPGEVALVWGDDLITPAREVNEYAKTKKEQVLILGGVFDGKFMDAAEMTEIATIPSRHQLYGMFVNLINSPIQRFAIVLDQYAAKREA